MLKTTAKYSCQVFRHLTIVVVVLGAFLFGGNKPSTKTSILLSGVNKQVAVTIDSKVEKDTWGKKLSFFKDYKQKLSLKASISSLPLAFQPQVVVFQAPNLALIFVPLKKALPPYAARAPGINFISRFFPVSIQPNAP